MLLNIRAIAGVLGVLVFFSGIALLLPALVDLIYGDGAWWTFLLTSAFSMLSGGACWYFFKPDEELRVREGFAIVAMAWLTLSLIGALPFILSGVLTSYSDAFFETMSGYTTTGATILGGVATPEIEAVPNAFLFWRSLTQWLGGMGIIVLTLAVLPLLGVGGMQLFRAETTGPSVDKLTPRVKETAKNLWLIYLALTGILVVLLLPAMGLFDAVNHAFTTMATGGYSTKNASVGHFDSAYVDWVITVFMFLAGVNFALHYYAARRSVMPVIRNEELRFYACILLVGTVLVVFATFQPTAGVLHVSQEAAPFEVYGTFFDSLRFSVFQVVSIATSTGYGTADYEMWPPLAMGVIFILFFSGGMAGSTAGGMKVIRHVLLFKNSFKELKQLLHPRAVIPVRLNGKVMGQDVMRNVLAFAVLYIGVVGLGTLLMALLGQDLLTAFGAAASSVGNIGPGFGTVGPVDNYAHIPPLGKWILALLMMIGRLEIFTVLILLTPSFWRS